MKSISKDFDLKRFVYKRQPYDGICWYDDGHTDRMH